MPTEDEIREKLKECYDPEIPVNIVDLGLIYEIEVDGEDVYVQQTLTSVGCPVADQMKAQVEQKVRELEGVESAECEIVYDPPWNPDMVTEEGKGQLSAMGIM